MKRGIALILCCVLFLAFNSVRAYASAKGSGKTEGKKIIVLATGGTIAGVGEAGKTAGYKPGTLTAEELLSAVPELSDVADIEAIQVCNVNSAPSTPERMLDIIEFASPETTL